MNAVRALETLRVLDHPNVRTQEAAAVLRISGSNASHLLASLQEAGSMMRIAPGRWSVSGRPRPYGVASRLTDPYPSYVSLYTALSRARHAVVICGSAEVLAAGAATSLSRSSGLAEKLAAL